MSAIIPESRVAALWQERLVGRDDLVTEEGRPVTVIYPGRPNDDRGPDFTDAVIATGSGVLKGDVEVHVRSSGWRAHRHHENPAYNRTVLHVVYRRDTETDAVLENGRRVPTLVLHRFTGGDPRELPETAGNTGSENLPCAGNFRRIDAAAVGMVIDAAGDERFRIKTEGFRSGLSTVEAGELLYRGIMRALGYSRNTDAMAELARRLPLREINRAVPGNTMDEEWLFRCQALLLGTAGLLPSQCPRQYGGYENYGDRREKLERWWAAYGGRNAMSPDDWCCYKIRPGNYPVRRIIAMSRVLQRYRREGLLNGLMGGFAAAAENRGRGLEDLFTVEEEDTGVGLPAVLGRGRAADIVINVLLPFTAAWGAADKALEIYCRYPASARNTIERHMVKQLGIGRHLVATARRQQGLLHIYRKFCSQGDCGGCPLG